MSASTALGKAMTFQRISKSKPHGHDIVPFVNKKLNESASWEAVAANLDSCAFLAYRQFRLDKLHFAQQRTERVGTDAVYCYLFLTRQIKMLESMSLEAALKGLLVKNGCVDYNKARLTKSDVRFTHCLESLANESNQLCNWSKSEITFLRDLAAYNELGRYPDSRDVYTISNTQHSKSEWRLYRSCFVRVINEIRRTQNGIS